jgi:hypothetical protein
MPKEHMFSCLERLHKENIARNGMKLFGKSSRDEEKTRGRNGLIKMLFWCSSLPFWPYTSKNEKYSKSAEGRVLLKINTLPDGPLASPLSDGPRSDWT